MQVLNGSINNPTVNGNITAIVYDGMNDLYIEKNYLEQFSNNNLENVLSTILWDTNNKKLTFLSPPTSQTMSVIDTIDMSLYITDFSIGNEIINSNIFSQGGNYLLISTSDYQTSHNYIIKLVLSTPFDITSTTSYQRWNCPQYASVFDVSSNGLYVYIYDSSSLTISQYELGAPFDFNKPSYKKSFTFSSFNEITGFKLSSDGTKIFCNPNYSTGLPNHRNIVTGNFSVPWDLEYLTVDSYLDASEISSVGYINFSSDGTKLYTQNAYTSSYYVYKLSNPWDISHYTSLFEITDYNYYFSSVTGEFTDNILYTQNFDGYIYKIQFVNNILDNITTSKSFVKDSVYGDNNEYKHVTLYANGTNLDDITFYIGENNNSTITYTELPTTGTTSSRYSSRTAITGTNKYGLNWKAEGLEGAEITRLQITYEKE